MTLEIAHPTVELPVRLVEEAQAHYRDHLGFDVAWHDQGGRIGAVSHGDAAIFLRETDAAITPITLWFYCEDVDRVYKDLFERCAVIVAPPLANTPWSLRQFVVRDLNGHMLTFFRDLTP